MSNKTDPTSTSPTQSGTCAFRLFPQNPPPPIGTCRLHSDGDDTLLSVSGLIPDDLTQTTSVRLSPHDAEVAQSHFPIENGEAGTLDLMPLLLHSLPESVASRIFRDLHWKSSAQRYELVPEADTSRPEQELRIRSRL